VGLILRLGVRTDTTRMGGGTECEADVDGARYRLAVSLDHGYDQGFSKGGYLRTGVSWPLGRRLLLGLAVLAGHQNDRAAVEVPAESDREDEVAPQAVFERGLQGGARPLVGGGEEKTAQGGQDGGDPVAKEQMG